MATKLKKGGGGLSGRATKKNFIFLQLPLCVRPLDDKELKNWK